jgi:hypothetical protein
VHIAALRVAPRPGALTLRSSGPHRVQLRAVSLGARPVAPPGTFRAPLGTIRAREPAKIKTG